MLNKIKPHSSVSYVRMSLLWFWVFMKVSWDIAVCSLSTVSSSLKRFLKLKSKNTIVNSLSLDGTLKGCMLVHQRVFIVHFLPLPPVNLNIEMEGNTAINSSLLGGIYSRILFFALQETTKFSYLARGYKIIVSCRRLQNYRVLRKQEIETDVTIVHNFSTIRSKNVLMLYKSEFMTIVNLNRIQMYFQCQIIHLDFYFKISSILRCTS